MNAEELRAASWIFWDALIMLPETQAAAYARLFFAIASVWAEAALQDVRPDPTAER